MIAHLLPLRESLWLRIVLVAIASIGGGALAYHALINYIQINEFSATYSSIAITVVIAILLAKEWPTNQLLQLIC